MDTKSMFRNSFVPAVPSDVADETDGYLAPHGPTAPATDQTCMIP